MPSTRTYRGAPGSLPEIQINTPLLGQRPIKGLSLLLGPRTSQFIQVIEDRQGLKIACIEEIAWHMGFIDDAQLSALAQPLMASGYGSYLMTCLEQR